MKNNNKLITQRKVDEINYKTVQIGKPQGHLFQHN